MASRRVLPRFFVLVTTAALATLPIISGLLPLAPARVTRAASQFPSSGAQLLAINPSNNFTPNFVVNAGIADLLNPPPTNVSNPTPASVTASAGSSALQGAALLRSDLSGSPLAGTPLVSLRLESLPIEIPLSTIPISRSTAPHTWQELLAGTVLAGIPIQNVTWSQVRALNPPSLGAITVGDVDWTGSALRDLPLAALTFGGADITTIVIPLQPGEPAGDTTPAQRWCYLLNQAQSGSCADPSSLVGQTLIGVGVRGAPLKNIPLKNIPLKNIDLTSSPLKNIPLKNIVLQVSPLKNIPLKNIDVADSPLKNIPLKNILLDSAGQPTASPLKNIPLKNIAWASSPLKNIPLKNIDLTSSPLKNIPLKNIDFADAPLKNIPLKNIDLVASGLGAIPLKNIDFANAPLKNIPLKNIDVASSPLKNIPLKNIDFADAPLRNIPLKNIDFADAPLKNIPLKNIDLTASGLGALPLDAILWTGAPLGSAGLGQLSFAAGPLSTIPLMATANPASIAGCVTAGTCSAGETLGQAGAAGDVLPGAKLADIGAAGFAGHGTLADLLSARTTSSTLDPALGDLRLDLAGPTAPAVTIEALVGALSGVPDPILGDLAIDLAAGDPTLGDLRLDVIADSPAMSVADLLGLLSASQPAVTLGDLRLDLAASAPATTVADLLGLLSASQPAVTLGDLRLDLANGVDALVLDAITGFLLDPADLAGYLLGALGTYTDATGHDITLGELGVWTDATGADITLGELAQYLDDSVSLADVLLGLVPPSQFPFQDFPTASLGLDKPGRQVVAALPPSGPTAATFVTGQQLDVQVSLHDTSFTDPSLPVEAEIVLPPGAALAQVRLGPRFSSQVITSGYSVSTLADGSTRVLIDVPAIDPGATMWAEAYYVAPLQLGPTSASYRVLDPSGPVVDPGSTLTVSLKDGAEPNTPQEEIAQLGFYSDNGRVPVLPVNPNGCSASDASCTGRDPNYIDAMIPGFISTPGDVDWYELPGVRAGSRISVDLANLPLDADLVLYGPAGTKSSPTLFPASNVPLPGQLVEDPGLGVGQAATALAAQALAQLPLDKGYTYPDSTIQAPMVPLSISAHRGTDPESVGVIAPVNGDATVSVAGNYVIAVSGYNGATSNLPYLLRAQVSTPPAEAACTARAFPFTTSTVDAIPAIPAGANALFLTDPVRLAQTYGDSAAGALTVKLANLVAYLDAHPELGIVPAVVPVDAYPDVASAYTTWDANPCSVSAANGVAAQVTGVIRGIQASNPGLAYITIVGGDDIIPMGRVPDLTRVSNESEYASTFGGATNPLSAAEAASFTLTDDVYGDTSPTSIGNGDSLFVPRLAVGRLVESPTDIGAQLDSFSANGGTLDTGTGLVAGYDFLADGAQAVASRLAVGGRSIDSSLIDQPNTTTPWTQADLLAKLFPTGGATPLIDSINAHYDHTALLPSAGNSGSSSQLETAADIAIRSAGQELAGRILFTMGCHAGLAVPDAYISGTDAPSTTLKGDWAQTLSAAGVSVYVANTGYGIGDTSSVAYSERLMALFAKLLDGSLTAGQALTYAKQAYYGSLGAVGVYDLKILQQAAFYGLPFWRVSTAPGATPPAPPAAPALPGPLATDSATGLQAVSVSLAPTFSQVTTARGSYWVVNGTDGPQDPQVTQYQPIQPRTSVSVGTTGITAHGALITSLTSHDIANVNPVLDTPTVDLSTSSPEIRTADSTWPGSVATVTTSQAPYGRAQDLVVVPGQFDGPTDGSGSQRLFDSIGASVLYAPDSATDFAPPLVASSTATSSGSTITFTVSAHDAEGPVKRVLVGYHDFDGSWRFVDLAETGTDTWTGTGATSRAFLAGDTVRYFVQAVDATGNVATASGKGAGLAARIPDATAPTITASISPAPNASGWIDAASATVSFTCADAGSGLDPSACPAPFKVTSEGTSTVTGTVIDQAGNATSTNVTVQLDRTAPTITATVSPAAGAAGWSTASSETVTFACTDAGSGLALGACPGPVSVTAAGSTPVHGSVTDIAGNTASTTVSVRIDRTAPTISATVAPPPNSSGWSKGTTATVTFTCSDGLSGIAAGACPAPATVPAQGVSVVSGTVLDGAGNRSTVSVTVRLDGAAPTVAFAGTQPAYTCATSDALSGVAASATLASSTVRVNGLPTTTVTCSGATDRAGNPAASISKSFVAPIQFSGFEAPDDGPPIVNTGHAGRAYPIKFQLRDAQGAFITVLPAVTSTTYQTVSCSAFTGTTDPLPTTTTGTSGLRYDSTANHYIYTWATPRVKGCYVFRLGLADGATYTADFNLK